MEEICESVTVTTEHSFQARGEKRLWEVSSLAEIEKRYWGHFLSPNLQWKGVTNASIKIGLEKDTIRDCGDSDDREKIYFQHNLSLDK